jgi:hypothetical protein
MKNIWKERCEKLIDLIFESTNDIEIKNQLLILLKIWILEDDESDKIN